MTTVLNCILFHRARLHPVPPFSRLHTIALNADSELPLALVGYRCSSGTDHKLQLSACLAQLSPSPTQKNPTLGNKVLSVAQTEPCNSVSQQTVIGDDPALPVKNVNL